jgi:hypothetical protein
MEQAVADLVGPDLRRVSVRGTFNLTLQGALKRREGGTLHHLWGSLDRPSLTGPERQLSALCDHRSSARIGPIEDWHALFV